MVRNFVALLLTLALVGGAEGRTARGPQPARRAVDIPNADIETALQMGASMPVSDRRLRLVAVDGEYNVAVAVVHRAKTAGRELDPGAAHKEITEIYHVVSGRGTLVTGGTLEEAKERPAANPLTGPTTQGKIINGRMRVVGPGDVIVIPPNTPHQFTEVTDDIVYLAIRIDPHKILPAK
jgi:mannose-6-phosphate isomerase-like protein (cupin superfamily)